MLVVVAVSLFQHELVYMILAQIPVHKENCLTCYLYFRLSSGKVIISFVSL